MELDITAQLDGIDFGPSTVLEEILQNVKTILATPKFSVPLDREFGLNATMLDSPTPAGMAALTAEVFEAVQRYEPRVKVKKVFFNPSEADALDGIVRPTVRVVIR